MMEIYGTIQFRLILPHIPGFQQEPLPEPVCRHSPDCEDCPYICYYNTRRVQRNLGVSPPKKHRLSLAA